MHDHNTNHTETGSVSLFALKPAERDIVVFHLRPSMAYTRRLGISLTLIAAGLALQIFLSSFWWGAPLLMAGTLLLCVRGYHNRVESGRFDPAATWEKVELDRLEALREIDRKMLRWSSSGMDVTSTRGLLALLLLLAPVAYMGYHHVTWGYAWLPWSIEVLLLDAVVLLLPHWLTGTRRVMRLPTLMVKVEALQALLTSSGALLADAAPGLMILLKGVQKVPDDVKLHVQTANAHADFMGLYVQVVTNDVKGASYPYVYTVLVARDGYGLERHYRAYNPPANVVKEFKRQDGVEIIVIRQHTTTKSGYHTSDAQAYTIFSSALELARKAGSQ